MLWPQVHCHWAQHVMRHPFNMSRTAKAGQFFIFFFLSRAHSSLSCYTSRMPKTLLGERPLFTVLAEIVAIWIVSDIGYYILVPLIGDYSTHPFKMAAYYLFWVGVTLINFWAFYRHWGTIKTDTSTLGIITLACIGIALYFYFIFPLFPALHRQVHCNRPPTCSTPRRGTFCPSQSR